MVFIKGKRKSKSPLGAIATLIGTTIGAGILGIPYVVAKSGLLYGLFLIIFIGVIILFVNLFFGEIVLRTKGNHQVPGYAEKYTGKFGKFFIVLSFIIGVYGAVIAYTIKSGEFLMYVFNGSNSFPYSLAFFAVMSVVIYFGIRAVEHSELVLVGSFILVILIVFFLGLKSVDLSNFDLVHPKYLFLPYGVILFAFLATGSIPEMKEQLTHYRKKIKNAIILGTIVPIIVYLAFAIVVVGITGKDTTTGAIEGLANVIKNPTVIKGAFIFGILAMATSFIALGRALKEMYMFDFGFKKFHSYLFTVMIPALLFLLLYFTGNSSFINILGIAGAISGGIAGAIIVWMYIRAKRLGDRQPEFSIKLNKPFAWFIILVFIIGVILKLLEVFGVLRF